MHAKSIVATVLATVMAVDAFSASSTLPTTRPALTVTYGYVPSGLTAEEWKKIKEKEAQKTKNLGKVGPRGFKSRSFQSFQEALERGEAAHLMPVENAKERLAKGEIKLSDIPYMQRGGSWDNSDVKGAKKAKWLKSDKEYAEGGFKKEQSISIFGGKPLDWTGTQGPSAPQNYASVAKPKGYKAPQFKDLVNNDDKPKKKNFFGF